MSLKIDIRALKRGSSTSKRVVAANRAKVARAAEKRLRAGFRVLLDATPVWSGDTLANYRVSVGSPDLSYSPYNQEIPYNDPSFTLAERDDAESRSLASLEAACAKIRMNPYQQIYITNNITYSTGEGIEALEFGRIGREAYGMFAKAHQVMESINVSGV